MDFRLASDYKPKGDQPNAIEELTRGIYAEQVSVSSRRECAGYRFARQRRFPYPIFQRPAVLEVTTLLSIGGVLMK